MNTPVYTPADLAVGSVRAGIARLVGSYPFHARVLERFRPRADPSVETMGVGLRNDRLELVFAPEFVAGITADELGGVLLHEVLHVVLGHLTANPDAFPDKQARMLAEEMTVNEFVREPLPGKPIVLAMFPNLPPDESTSERYRRLAGRVPKKWQARLGALPDSGTRSSSPGQDVPGSANPPTEPVADEHTGDGEGDGDAGECGGDGPPGASAGADASDNASPGGNAGAGAGAAGDKHAKRAGQAPGSGSGSSSGVGGSSGVGNSQGSGGEVTKGNARPTARPRSSQPGLVDNHSGWPSTHEQREAFRTGLADLITDVAADTPVPVEIAESLRGCGVVPGQGKYVVRGEATGALDWRTLLRRYVGRELRVEPRYGRPPRRFPDLAGIVPGRGRAEGEVSVVAVVDTSGSMSDPMLEDIAGELRRLGRHHPIHVVECDCAVHRTYRFRGRLVNVEGRGGTDFRPPLKRAFLRRLRPRPAVVIVFTDGDGPAPLRPPAVPLIWCLTPGGWPPAPWGRVVKMGPGGAPARTTDDSGQRP